MSNEASTSQQTEPRVEGQTPAGSSATAVDTPRQQANGTTGPSEDIEMNGHDAQDKSKQKDKNGEEVQDQTEEELSKIYAARREEEMARRDRSLAEFLVMLDGYKPLVSFLSRPCAGC